MISMINTGIRVAASSIILYTLKHIIKTLNYDTSIRNVFYEPTINSNVIVQQTEYENSFNYNEEMLQERLGLIRLVTSKL